MSSPLDFLFLRFLRFIYLFQGESDRKRERERQSVRSPEFQPGHLCRYWSSYYLGYPPLLFQPHSQEAGSETQQCELEPEL